MRAPLVVVVAFATCAFLPATARAQPQIARTCNGSLVCNVWFTKPVLLDWTYTGTPTAGCVDMELSQDTPGAKLGCIVIEGQESASIDVTIKIDLTPPEITAAAPDRPPDRDGWYVHPVTFTPKASDSTSGIASCDSVIYSGPDGADAAAVATCRDIAGNVGSRAFPLRYDATPPDPGAAALDTGDRVVRLGWPAAAKARIVRSPGVGGAARSVVYSGPGRHFKDRGVRNGRLYRYVVTLTDQAGNVASAERSGVPGPHLVTPGRRAVVGAPPVLRWTPVRGASYYNVQLFRGERKILSAWPARPRLRLASTWRFRGRRRQLADGPYRWYVWPGKGRRAERRYGKLIGRRSFVVG